MSSETNASVKKPTAEQQEQAGAATVAMAEKFSVSAEEFSVFPVIAGNGRRLWHVAYAGSIGIDLGDPDQLRDEARSWRGIFSPGNEEKFIVDVNGEKIDTRKGMTLSVYEAFIADAKDQGVNPLPDTIEAAAANGHDWHFFTWLTGQPSNLSGSALVACVMDNDKGWIYHYPYSVDSNRTDYRFRPAARIK